MWQTIKRRIIAGLIALMPIMATYWIIRLLFDFLDRFSDPLLKTIGVQIPGLGIILTILFIFIFILITFLRFFLVKFTNQINLRARGRSFSLKVDSSATGMKWKLGSPRVSLRPDGRR